MKKLILLITLILVSSCNNDTSKPKEDESNLIDGYYKCKLISKTESNLPIRYGFWIFSKNEINVFHYDGDKLGVKYGETVHDVIFKYYIKNNILYTCNNTADDCFGKKSFDKYNEIISNEIKDNKQTIILEDKYLRIELTKTKEDGLNVKDWVDNSFD